MQFTLSAQLVQNITLLSSLLIVTIHLQAQDWKKVGPGSERSFYMIDSASYLIGSEGKILKYTAGRKKQVYNSGRTLNDIDDFTDNGEGTIYAVISIFSKSYSRVVKSHDKGETWEVKDVYNMPSPYSIYFYNKNLGFIGCSDARIYRTIDGGENWKLIKKSNYINFKSFAFVNEDLGFAVGGRVSNSKTLKTENGGDSWSSWYWCGVDVNCAFFSSDSIGYFTSSTGVYKHILTENMHKRLSAPAGEGYGPVYFINDTVGYLAVHNNKIGQPHFHDESDIYYTEDGGESWVLQSAPSILARITHFYRRGNRMYVNCGSISNETGEVVLSTQIDSNYLSSTNKFERNFNISIYPNPAQNELIINGLLNFDFQIFTVDGKNVMNGYINNRKINISALEAGIYILKVSAQKKSGASIFIKN